MTIPPVIGVPLEVLTALPSASALRESGIVKAKVTAMLSETQVRLAIDGLMVDVTTPKPLPVGTTISLRADWKSGQLTLLTREPSASTPAPAAPNLSASALGQVIDPLKLALTKIQTLAIDTMLTGRAAAGTAQLGSPAATQTHQETQRPPTPDMTARGQAAAPPSAIASAENLKASDAVPRNAAATDRPDAVQPQNKTDLSVPPPRADRVAAFTVEIPVYFNETAMPLRLEVSRREEAAEQDEGEARAPSWMVRFSSDTASLGMIHAAISLIDGHIGVQFWAERDETADWFRQNSPQLKDALVASDLDVDGVFVAQGSSNRQAE